MAASVLNAATSSVTSVAKTRQLATNQAADTAVLNLLIELPSLWATSLDLAQCTGLDHKAAQASAKRLADLGVITQRTEFYRSARARIRRRLEYCHPGQAAAWQRLPTRLEPPLYQINQSSCRVVLADIDQRLVAIARLISRAADDSSAADDQLRAAVDQARLAEARRQAA